MAKQAASRPSSSPRKKSAPPPELVTATAEPSHEQIAERAYGLWLSRGAHDGDALDDWYRAERELRDVH
jgi:hypothetical protein